MPRKDVEVAVTTGSLTGHSFTGVLEEDIGKVAFHKVSSVGGEAAYVEREGSTCLDLGSESLTGKVAMLLLEESCTSVIASMARSLADRGAVAVVLNSHSCLCEALSSNAVKSSSTWCAETSCLDYMQPRGEPEADTLSIPLITMSNEDFGTITDCLGDTDFVADDTLQDSCTSDIPTIRLSWDFQTANSGDLEVEVVSQIGADISVSPFKSLAFLNGVLDVIGDSIGTWTMRPPVLDGTAIERDCSSCTEQHEIINCTAPPTDLQTLCDGICINEGRYCQPSITLSATDSTYTVSGALLVQESLRQICLMQQVSADAGLVKNFFTYLREMELNCLTSSTSLTESCSEARQTSNGFDASVTATCVTNSGTTGENTILENIMRTPQEYIEDLDIIKAPSYRVNDVTIPFSNSWGNMLSAICASISGTSPDFCSCIYNDDSAELRSDDNLLSKCFGIASSGSTTVESSSNAGLIAGVVIAVVVVLGAAGFLVYRRYFRSSAQVTREQELQDLGGDTGATGARAAIARCFGFNSGGTNGLYPTKT
ncbi:Vacuolar-sorting receptor 1 [Hondaea fermentalgiana]|uniref:Vacuolar-sorting receptor 1 n=1 Tax=Hondaea fermentalgiana TaxID=2315210 RepID=A0A2R5GNV6_9STRA|nr:Vacuolar-sorting receptor 1 [Hondaea fermentalgiana]|eukprot:GBG29554.1 Vacuolar-sorting receptor 1 [Hondaea fermentalgiana]